LERKLYENKSAHFLKIIAFVFLALTFIDQLRFEFPTWSAEQYETSRFDSLSSQIEIECSSFYINTEGKEWWDDQLQAMTLSSELGVSTSNGYSGGYPAGYPAQEWRSKTNLFNVGIWLKSKDALDGSCVVGSNLIEKFDQEVFIQAINGFDLLEKTINGQWRWAISNENTLRVMNFQNTDLNGFLNFTITKPKCQESISISIGSNSETQTQDLRIDKTNSKVKLPVSIRANDFIDIQFIANSTFCNIENDPRKLYFGLSSVKFVN